MSSTVSLVDTTLSGLFQDRLGVEDMSIETVLTCTDRVAVDTRLCRV